MHIRVVPECVVFFGMMKLGVRREVDFGEQVRKVFVGKSTFKGSQ